MSSEIPSGPRYQQDYQTFSQQQPPDPNTFLKQVWGHLTPHQQELFSALLRRPVASNNGQGMVGQNAQHQSFTPQAATTTAAAQVTAPLTNDQAARNAANAEIKKQAPNVAGEILRTAGFDPITATNMVNQTGAQTLLTGLAHGSTLSPTGPKTTNAADPIAATNALNQKQYGTPNAGPPLRSTSPTPTDDIAAWMKKASGA